MLQCCNRVVSYSEHSASSFKSPLFAMSVPGPVPGSGPAGSVSDDVYDCIVVGLGAHGR